MKFFNKIILCIKFFHRFYEHPDFNVNLHEYSMQITTEHEMVQTKEFEFSTIDPFQSNTERCYSFTAYYLHIQHKNNYNNSSYSSWLVTSVSVSDTITVSFSPNSSWMVLKHKQNANSF